MRENSPPASAHIPEGKLAIHTPNKILQSNLADNNDNISHSRVENINNSSSAASSPRSGKKGSDDTFLLENEEYFSAVTIFVLRLCHYMTTSTIKVFASWQSEDQEKCHRIGGAVVTENPEIAQQQSSSSKSPSSPNIPFGSKVVEGVKTFEKFQENKTGEKSMKSFNQKTLNPTAPSQIVFFDQFSHHAELSSSDHNNHYDAYVIFVDTRHKKQLKYSLAMLRDLDQGIRGPPIILCAVNPIEAPACVGLKNLNYLF